MFQVEFAPDAVCQLEHLMQRQLESGGRADAYFLLNSLEACIAALRENPVSEGIHMKGIPRRYKVKEILPGIFLIYQVDEEARRVKVDSLTEDSAEIL